MKQFQGIWMPSGERELIDWMSRNGQLVEGRGTYQYPKLVETLAHCTNFRTCIDQGSHIGLWTMHLAKRFDSVVCFEPVQRLAECWEANMRGDPNISKCKLLNLALGKEPGEVVMFSHGTACGDSSVEHDASKMRVINSAVAAPADKVRMVTLDSLEPIDVDLIKCDAEGYEENILRGAEQTIRKWKPTIVVEQKRDMARKYGLEPQGAIAFLRTLGYVPVKEMGGDFIMVHKS